MRKEKIRRGALLLMLLVIFLSGCETSGDSDRLKAEKLLEYDAGRYVGLEATGSIEGGVRVINIKAYQFFFDPATVIVNRGEKIRLIVEAMDVPHGFEIEGLDIPGYDIDAVIEVGKPLVLEFTADEEGVWEFLCSIYCGHGHSTMKGIFVVR